MSLQLKYTDDNGILHINMSPPSSSPRPSEGATEARGDIKYPDFDTINQRFSHYDIFGGKYDVQYESGGEQSEVRSLFRSRYNSVEEELANTPYAFATERLRINDNLDITIESALNNVSPSKDLEDDRFFDSNRALNLKNEDNLFGPTVDFEILSKSNQPPAFTVTQLIHAQDRYFDLSKSGRNSTQPPSKASSPVKVTKKPKVRIKSDSVSAPGSARSQRTVKIARTGVKASRADDSTSRADKEAFKVLTAADRVVKAVEEVVDAVPVKVIPTAKRKRESSFAIIPEPPLSRPTSPASLPVDLRTGRLSPFRGRGFREETSRHATPNQSKVNTPRTSRSNSPRRREPLRYRTSSLSRLDMAQVVALPPPISLSRPHSPRNYIKQNIEEVREISELNREQHEIEAEQKRREEEEAILREMGLIDNNANETKRSRSNSPSKVKLRSRSNSPSAILHYEKIPEDSKDFINPDDGIRKPAVHRSRLTSVSRSQPQSNNGSPKHSKIPKRQNSVSPTRHEQKNDVRFASNLHKTQRFISNSTSSIQESIRIGRTTSDQKTGMSKSNQHLNISPSILKSKPPISPGKIGPPPTNRFVNAKRLSPIVGTPNKSPTEDIFSKPSSARASPKVSPINKLPKKPIKTAGNTPASSRFASKTNSRVSSRDQSPEKRRNTVVKSSSSSNIASKNNKTDDRTNKNPTIKRTPSRPNVSKPNLPTKPDPKKAVSRTNSVRNLTRTNSTKTLTDKVESMKKEDAKKGESTKSGNKNDFASNKGKTGENKAKSEANKPKSAKVDAGVKADNEISLNTTDEKAKQDNETQYDKQQTNENGDHLIPLTKMSVVSMTTAAITSQPLDVVTKVTNQLPTALEKAREKGVFERISSNDSILGKNDDDSKEGTLEKKSSKSSLVSIKEVDNVKLKPLQPPFNNPQVEKVKQKIDDILKSPEVSTENILSPIQREIQSAKDSAQTTASTTKAELQQTVKEIKDNSKISTAPEVKDFILKKTDKATDDIRNEVSKIVDSIMTPIEEPKEKARQDIKKSIEPVVTIVNKKPAKPETIEVMEKMTEAVIKGEAEVEVQSSNMKTPEADKMAAQKAADGADSDKSSYSNGGLPKSTSTTPRPIPPARTKSTSSKDATKKDEPLKIEDQLEAKKNLCQRLMGKCANKCSCCGKKEEEVKKEVARMEAEVEEKKKEVKGLSRLNCCRKTEDQDVEKAERGAGKSNTIEFENETTKRKRGLSDALCGCCKRRHKIGDSSSDVRRAQTNRGGCCGRLACWRRKESEEDWAMRRDSILSDRPLPPPCCNNRACGWLCVPLCGLSACCRRAPPPPDRRLSMFSKNKSLSPTLPTEDTRTKLDTSLVEHTSTMRGAIPVLPICLAYFCLLCNVLVPGLGTVLSGILCLCFGIPRFGVHDGPKPRIGSFLINILVGAAQLFTVLFCLVGWGWSIWWGTIMLKVARKYRKIRETEAADEERAAPPVTTNNHTIRT